MGEDRPRYYRLDKAGRNAFWAPGKFAEKYGLPKSQPLGPDGPEAKAAAIKWNGRLDEARKLARSDEKPPSRYPEKSVGAFFEAYQRTESWAQMEPRTREDYFRAWPIIEKRFARTPIRSLTPDDSEKFHVDIHPAYPPSPKRDPKGKLKLSWGQAHRTLKVWRSLLNAMVKYDVRATAPVGKVANPQPSGRRAVWLHDEVMKLAETACWGGHLGMAIAIRLAWDAMLSPVDVWALPLSGWSYSPGASEVNTARAKTSAPVLVAVENETAELIEAYLARLGLKDVIDDDRPLIRQANGRPFPDKDRFGKIFRMVREAAFPGDDRQFLDLRRSALTEAQMGGATKDDIGAAAANRIAEDERLASTYLRAASKRVLSARREGRAPMAAKFAE